MMMNIIDRFNKFFDEEQRGIPKERMEFYKEFFLMDKEYKPGNKAVKKRFEQLIGMERTKPKSKKPKLVRSGPKNSLYEKRTKKKK